MNFRPWCGQLSEPRPALPVTRCGGAGRHPLAPHSDPRSCSSWQPLSLSGPQFLPLESWSQGLLGALSHSKTWISVPGFRALPHSHALGHRTASPVEGVCQSHPESLRGHLLSPDECLIRAFYSLPTLWKVENHSSEAIGALECSGLTDEKADWPRTPTGPESKLDWEGTSAVGRVWLLLGRSGRPGGRPPTSRAAGEAEAAFAQARLGPHLSQVDHYAVASLASPAKCKSISEIAKQPLGTVPRRTGQLLSWTSGCFHEILFDKSAFDQMFHSRGVFCEVRGWCDGAQKGWLSTSAKPERFLWIEPLKLLPF